MTKWVLKGLKTGIVTTTYPDRDEAAPGVSPGLPGSGMTFDKELSIDVEKCPTQAFIRDGQGLGGGLPAMRTLLSVCYRRTGFDSMEGWLRMGLPPTGFPP